MRRLALVAALAAAAATALPSHAVNSKPQIVDAATDSLGGQAGLEITSALWTTTGITETSKVRGRKVTTYTPKKLVATINLAGAPLQNPPFYYETSASVAGCGTVRFTYGPGTAYNAVTGSATAVWYDCGPGDSVQGPGLTLVLNVPVKFGPKSITWEYSIKAFGKSVKVGAPVTDFHAVTDVVDPVFGLSGPKDFATPIDEGIGEGVWKLGS